MKYLWLAIAAGSCVAGLLIAAEIAVNLGGTWVLDPAQSQIWHTSPNLPNIAGVMRDGNADGREDDARSDAILLASQEIQIQYLTLQITQTRGEMQILREFTTPSENKQTISQKFLLDGSQCFNVDSNGEGEFVSRANWKNGKLINSGIKTITKGMRRSEVAVKEEYSISKDGKKLTINISSADPKGVLHFKQIFRRK